MRGINMKMALLSILLMSMLAGIIAVRPTHANGPVISLSPVMNGPGDFDVDVMIADVVDLYGYEFKVLFDEYIVNTYAIDVGDFFMAGDPPGYKVWKNDIGAGDIAWLAVTRPLGSVSGVSGSGILATIHFTEVGTGATYLELTDVLMGDPFNIPIVPSVEWGYFSNVATVFDCDLVKRRDMVRPERYEWAYSRDLDKLLTLYAGVENLGTVPTRVGVFFTLSDGTIVEALIVVIDPTGNRPVSLTVDWAKYDIDMGYTAQVWMMFDSDGDGILDTVGSTVRSFDFVVVMDPLD